MILQWLAQGGGGALGGGQAGSLKGQNIGYQAQTPLKDKYKFIFPVSGRENIDTLPFALCVCISTIFLRAESQTKVI